MSKDAVYRKLIQSRRWRTLRVATLKSRPYCESELHKGKRIGATEVHHIHPVEPALGAHDKERLMFDPLNLQCLCRDCHLQIHKEMRVHSKETVKSRQKERIERVLSTFFPGVSFEEVRPGG